MEREGYNADGCYYDKNLHEVITLHYSDYYFTGKHIEAYLDKQCTLELPKNLPSDFVVCKKDISDIYDMSGNLIVRNCATFWTRENGETVALREESYNKYFSLYDKNRNLVTNQEFNGIIIFGNIVICKTGGYNKTEYSLYSIYGISLTTEKFSKYEIKNEDSLFVNYEGYMHQFVAGKGIIPIRSKLTDSTYSIRMGNACAIEIDGQASDYLYSSLEHIGGNLIKAVDKESGLIGIFDNKGELILPCEYCKTHEIRCQIGDDGCLRKDDAATECVIFAQKPNEEDWYVYSHTGDLYRKDKFCDIVEKDNQVLVCLTFYGDHYQYSLYYGIIPIKQQLPCNIATLKLGNVYALEVNGKKKSDFIYSSVKGIGKNLFVVTEHKNGLQRILDHSGTGIFPFLFDDMETFECSPNGLEHLFQDAAPTDSITILFIHNPNDKKWYVYTTAGRLCRADQHEGIQIEDGRMYAKIGEELYPYSITNGILPIETEIRNGLWINRLNGKYSLANKEHETGYFFDSAKDEKYDYIKVSMMADDEELFGLYTYDCLEFLPCSYASIKYLMDGGFALQGTANQKWGACDTEGGLVLPFEYDWIRYSKEANCYIVHKDNACKLIDKDNRVKASYPTGFDVYHITPDGLAFVRNSDKKCGVCDKNGRLIIEPNYVSITTIGNGLYILSAKKTITEVKRVKKSNYWGNDYFKKVSESKSVTENILVRIQGSQASKVEATQEDINKLIFSNKYSIGQRMSAVVTSKADFGIFVRLSDGLTSLLPNKYLSNMGIKPDDVPIGRTYEVSIKKVIPEKKQVMILLVKKQKEDSDDNI